MEYPDSYNNLNYRNRAFVDCYLNEGLVEPCMHAHTFCNELASYVFVFNKQQAVRDCLEFKYYVTDNFGNVQKSKEYVEGCKVEIIVKNAAKYLSLNKSARMVLKACGQAINEIRMAMYSSDDKSKELELKDAIFRSSIKASDFKDRNENRKMMMKIFGLDQVKIDTSVDIYEASGKNILARMRSGGGEDRDDTPIVPIDVNDIDSKGGEEE